MTTKESAKDPRKPSGGGKPAQKPGGKTNWKDRVAIEKGKR